MVCMPGLWGTENRARPFARGYQLSQYDFMERMDWVSGVFGHDEHDGDVIWYQFLIVAYLYNKQTAQWCLWVASSLYHVRKAPKAIRNVTRNHLNDTGFFFIPVEIYQHYWNYRSDLSPFVGGCMLCASKVGHLRRKAGFNNTTTHLSSSKLKNVATCGYYQTKFSRK